MVPAIAFAYENAELDIMSRQPRNAKLDALMGKKLFSYAYLQIGMIQQAGGVFIYFFVMNDYGFRPGTLINLNYEYGYFPKSSDVYNPNLPHNGNTNYGIAEHHSKLDWLKNEYGAVDLRLFYVDRPASSWSHCRWNDNDTPLTPRFYRYSSFTDAQICYTSESLKYAHTAYMVGIVAIQVAGCIACKTRIQSVA